MIGMMTVFMILMILGMPIAFAIGIAGFSYFIVAEEDMAMQILVSKIVSGGSSFPLLAIPFFIFAGNVMNACGITHRLIDFSIAIIGHMRGGLAKSSLVLSTLMGGISGSCVADAAMQSRILGPDMLKKGYSRQFAAAVIGCGSLITPTLPPSIGLILYGVVGEVSIGRLFTAGVVPGILMLFILLIPTHLIAKKRGYKRERETRAPVGTVLKCARESIWALLFPVILLIGIRMGYFTPSEAGAFAVLYACIIGLFVHKELNYANFMEAVRKTVRDNAVVMATILFAYVLGAGFTYSRGPAHFASWIVTITSDPTILIILILLAATVSGMFIEAAVNTLLMTPIFLPVIKQAGVDPVFFGLIFVTTITLGSMTPPVGTVMFTVCSLLKCPTEKYFIESIPFVLAIVALIAVMIMFPQIVMFLPNLIYGS